MLRHAATLRIGYEAGRHQRGWLVLRVAAEHHRLRLVDRREFEAIERWSDATPQRIGSLHGQSIWLYKGTFYSGELHASETTVTRLLRSTSAA